MLLCFHFISIQFNSFAIMYHITFVWKSGKQNTYCMYVQMSLANTWYIDTRWLARRSCVVFGAVDADYHPHLKPVYGCIACICM